jgi:hypothetical protein
MSESSSASRAATNCENAQKSTGPVTEAGKRVCSLNALRHGLTGQTVVMPSEDVAEYQRFTQNLHDDMKPMGALEIQLAQSLADDAWRLNRAKALETDVLTLSLHGKDESIVDVLRQQAKALATLSMHQNRISRTFKRNPTQFRQIQEERRERERRDMNTASVLYQGHLKLNLLTTAQIEQFLRRQTPLHADCSGPLYQHLAA